MGPQGASSCSVQLCLDSILIGHTGCWWLLQHFPKLPILETTDAGTSVGLQVVSLGIVTSYEIPTQKMPHGCQPRVTLMVHEFACVLFGYHWIL